MGEAISAVVCITCLVSPFLIWWICVYNAKEMPKIHITDLYIPALNTQLPNFNSTTITATFIFFELELKNEMSEVGVRYDNVDLRFYYCTPKSSLSIANYTIPGFYQGHKKTAHRRDVVETRGVPWLDAFAAVSNGSTVTLTVEFSAGVKLKREFGYYLKRKELLLGANMKVNGYGEKVEKKSIELKRRVPKRMKVTDMAATLGFTLQVVESNTSVHSA